MGFVLWCAGVQMCVLYCGNVLGDQGEEEIHTVGGGGRESSTGMNVQTHIDTTSQSSSSHILSFPEIIEHCIGKGVHDGVALHTNIILTREWGV